MKFLQTLFLAYFAFGLVAIAVAFGPETYRFLRNKYWAVFPFSAPVWYYRLRKRYRAWVAQYKRLGLPPLSAILFVVAVICLYVFGTAIL